MIKIENVVLPHEKQWEAIIRGMRNPLNSWDKSDRKNVEICFVESVMKNVYHIVTVLLLVQMISTS